jgi:hypothetical protein
MLIVNIHKTDDLLLKRRYLEWKGIIIVNALKQVSLIEEMVLELK